MGVAEDIRKLAKDVPRKREQVRERKEDPTKTSLVMPFIAALGYNIHDPDEVDPEFNVDVEVKQEAVDYAILKDGKPILLVECKRASDSLNNKKHLSQLIGYYNATEARFGILTNGVEYRFYTDLRKTNLMDRSPFLVVDMLDLKDGQVTELCRFGKHEFEAQAIWDTVYAREIEQRDLQTIAANISREFANPSRDLVRLLAKGVLGKGVQKRAENERVKGLVRRALDRYAATPVTDSPSPLKTEEEARKERQRKAGIKAAETQRRNLEAYQTSTEPDYSRYLNWQRLIDTPELHSPFVALRDFARSLGDDVKVNPTQRYIGFRRKNTFAYVRLQPGLKRLLVYVYADLERTDLREGFTSLLPERHHYGSCNLKVFIDSRDKLERAKPLIKRSYDEAG